MLQYKESERYIRFEFSIYIIPFEFLWHLEVAIFHHKIFLKKSTAKMEIKN
jgi:hypothetical protein